MKRTTTLLVAIALLVGGAAAQANSQNNVDTVILASTANYPDAMISAAPANKLGIPVLLTDKNSLSQSTSSALDSMNPSEVVIVGGPAVISEEVQSKVESRVNSVTRLWGTTQVGTSNELASYFWTEGSDEATVVQYPQNTDSYRLLSAVKNEVQNEDEPILISKEGTLSATTLATIENLGAKEVEVYSTNAVNVTEDLKEVGVEEVELEEAGREELRETVEQRMKERRNLTLNPNGTLVIVAATNFRQSISVPSYPNSNSLVIGSEEEIDEMLETVSTSSAQNIKVVGKPDLARELAERIESETNRSVDFVSGPPEQIAANFTERNRDEWREIQQERMPEWAQQARTAPGLQKAANRSLTRARSSLSENATDEAVQALEEAEEAFQNGDYFEAKKLATRALSEHRASRFRDMTREEVMENAREEREDMKEAMREVREQAREMSRELQEAETVEERLEITREFREERDAMKESRGRKGPRGPRKAPGRNDSLLENRTDDNQTGKNRSEDEDAVEVGETEIEVEAEEETDNETGDRNQPPRNRTE